MERVLEKLWSQNRASLGWELLDDQLLILPGGTTTAYYNNDFENLPSDYAANQPDDDRAESVVAFLFDQEKVNEARKSILDQVLDPSPQAQYEVIQKEAVLPELPEITVKFTDPLNFAFKIGKVTINQNPKPPIPLNQYRKMRKT